MIGAAVAHGAAERQAVDSGNHDVEDEEIVAGGLGTVERFPSVTQAVARVPFQAEVQAHQFPDVGLVLDNENTRGCHHLLGAWGPTPTR